MNVQFEIIEIIS